MAMKSTNSLIRSEILQIGKMAKENPVNLSETFALGIANKDYPAMTPFLWNSVYQSLDINIKNIRLFGNPENMDSIFKTLKSDSSYIGGDIGVGFKDKVWDIIDELDPIALAMQSINVIVRTDEGKLRGYNTDGLGYVVSLEEVLQKSGRTLRGKKIVLLGAGGTSNSIAFYLAERGAEIVILNRTISKAEALAGRVNEYFQSPLASFGGRELIAEEVKDTAAVIALIDDPSSPLYRYSALGSINLPPTEDNIESNLKEARKIMDGMPKDAVVSDVMLREYDTTTIMKAKSYSFETLDGKPMVLNQAIEAFWLVNQKVLENMCISKQDIRITMSKVSI